MLGLFLALGVLGPVIGAGILRLDKYSSFLTAGASTSLFFGGGWALWHLAKRMQEPVCLLVLPNELVELNQRTGRRRTWLFSDILACRASPPVKGTAVLRLTLRQGTEMKLIASNISFLTNHNLEQFAQMASAVESAWQKYRQVASACEPLA